MLRPRAHDSRHRDGAIHAADEERAGIESHIAPERALDPLLHVPRWRRRNGNADGVVDSDYARDVRRHGLGLVPFELVAHAASERDEGLVHRRVHRRRHDRVELECLEHRLAQRAVAPPLARRKFDLQLIMNPPDAVYARDGVACLSPFVQARHRATQGHGAVLHRDLDSRVVHPRLPQQAVLDVYAELLVGHRGSPQPPSRAATELTVIATMPVPKTCCPSGRVTPHSLDSPVPDPVRGLASYV